MAPASCRCGSGSKPCHRPCMILREGIGGQCPPYTSLLCGQQSLAVRTPLPSWLETRSKAAVRIMLTFFLGALGAFVVKIKHHAAAGKTLYLRNRGPGLAAGRPHRGRFPGLLAGGGLFLPLLRDAPGSRRSRPGWPPWPSARYSSETVMNYADWEAGQPLKKTSMAGFHLCPVWESPGPGRRRDRHPHGAGPGLRLRLPPHHPGAA